MSHEDIPIRAVERLRLEPGDIVLVTLPDGATQADIAAILASWRHVLDRAGLTHEVQVIVQSDDIAVRVVSANPEPPLN